MSSKSEDLTADLLHDLTEEQAHPADTQPPPTSQPAPSATVQTSVFLAPGSWKRPGITRAGRSLSINAGPVQIRFGR